MSELPEKMSINLTVGGRVCSLVIPSELEQEFRAAAKEVNDTIGRMRMRYASTDTYNLLAIASVQFVMKMNQLIKKEDEIPTVAKINQMAASVEEMLRSAE